MFFGASEKEIDTMMPMRYKPRHDARHNCISSFGPLGDERCETPLRGVRSGPN